MLESPLAESSEKVTFRVDSVSIEMERVDAERLLANIDSGSVGMVEFEMIPDAGQDTIRVPSIADMRSALVGVL